MDLYSAEVQAWLWIGLKLLAGALALWLARRGNTALTAVEKKADEATKSFADGRFLGWAKTAVRWAEELAAKQLGKTGAEKKADATAFLQKLFPDVPADTISKTIDAVVNEFNEVWKAGRVDGFGAAAIGESYSAPVPGPLADIHEKLAQVELVAEAAKQEAAAVGQTIQGLAKSFGLGGVKVGGPSE